MVEEEHGATRRIDRETIVQPRELPGAQLARVLAGQLRVEADHEPAAPLDAEADAVADLLGGRREDTPQRRPVVVIAGNDPEPVDPVAEILAELLVGRLRFVVGRVPGDDEEVEVRDATRGCPRSLGASAAASRCRAAPRSGR